MNKLDLTGSIYGMLTVLEESPKKTRAGVYWLARCECGNTVEVSTKDLRRKDRRRRISCGCMNHKKGENSEHWKSPNPVPHTYFSAIKASAKRRNLTFDVTIEYLWEIFVPRCALSGREITLGENASLDRIDSSRGYEVGNIQWVDSDVNQAKSSRSDQDFIELCKEVTKWNSATVTE